MFTIDVLKHTTNVNISQVSKIACLTEEHKRKSPKNNHQFQANQPIPYKLRHLLMPHSCELGFFQWIPFVPDSFL